MKKIGLLLVMLVGCAKADFEAAKKSAEEYSKNVPNATGVSCVQSDSDGDGYCSCTIFRKDEDPLAIECGCEVRCLWNCASGCKYTPIGKVRVR